MILQIFYLRIKSRLPLRIFSFKFGTSCPLCISCVLLLVSLIQEQLQSSFIVWHKTLKQNFAECPITKNSVVDLKDDGAHEC